jgi:glutamate carboxypeptidase
MAAQNDLIISHLQPRLDTFVTELGQLSEMECGTYDKNGVDAVGRVLRARLQASQAETEVHPDGDLGDSLVARWRGSGGVRLLLIGHLDTVYPPGWTADHPFSIDGDRARGPGTADMKAGVLAGLYAVEALLATGFDRFAEIAYILNSDEEIGSPSSTGLIRREAHGRDAVLVLEAGRANGNIVSARKGLAPFDLTVMGRAAHAGVEPQAGRSAILELANQTVALHKLNDHERGITVNVGVVEGGTRRNVVAAEATAKIDVRARTVADLESTISAMYALAAQPTVADTTVILRGGIDKPPMERTAATERLIAWCEEAAADAGFAVRDTATGGGSDGNTTAAMGVPTLDGLGPVGGGAHSPDEWVSIPSIVPRVAMLAGLMVRICLAEGVR